MRRDSRTDKWMATALGLIALAIMFAGTASPTHAQATGGSIAGIVVRFGSQSPVEGVRIEVVNTTLQTMTDAAGRFRLTSVQGDTVILRATRIGLQPVTQPVSVGSTDLRVVMQDAAISLDQIVVTGTSEGTQKRALGNAVSVLDISAKQVVAPVANVEQALKANAPGVYVLPSSGQVGSSGRIRVRGVSSITLGLQPILYIDGVRVDNRSRSRIPGSNQEGTNRLGDLDPADIESIEIIKGPAAATLYGTDASSGVIQVITKRGASGASRLVVSASAGANWIHDQEGRFRTYYRRNPDGSLFNYHPTQFEADRGTPFFRTGQVRDLDIQLSGGTNDLQYYVSGGNNLHEGPMAPNNARTSRARANFTAIVNSKTTLVANAAYTGGKTTFNNEGFRGTWQIYSPCISAACWTDGRGFAVGGIPHDDAARVYKDYEDRAIFTAGTTVTYRPWESFTNRLVLGFDKSNVAFHTVVELQTDPRILAAFGANALGFHSLARADITTKTVDYAGTYRTRLPRQIDSKTTIGFQYLGSYVESSGMTGRRFPAPGITAISAAADRTTTAPSATFLENNTVGIFLEEELSLNDRLFVTAAIRMDDNSAFGEEFSPITYPKLSASWVASEEPFWRFPFINTFKLRAAYGQSGRQPDNFASLAIYSPISAPGGVAGVAPASLGNARLGPERGEEIEAGFDAGLLDDRLGIEFTYYNKYTNDAILNQTTPPSLGYPGSSPVNIGKIRNTGLELQVKGSVLRRENLDWDLAFTSSYNTNRVLDMRGIPPLPIGPTQQTRQGWPLASFFGPKVIGATVADDGTVSNIRCDGGRGRDGLEPGGPAVDCATAPRVYLGRNTPKWEGSLASNVTLLRRLELSALMDYSIGSMAYSYNDGYPCDGLRACEINVFPEVAKANPLLAGDIVRSRETQVLGILYHTDMTYARLRQVSASYILPDRLLRALRASAATLTMTARNLPILYQRDKHTRYDPDVESNNGQFQLNFFAVPQPIQFLTSLRLTF